MDHYALRIVRLACFCPIIDYRPIFQYRSPTYKSPCTMGGWGPMDARFISELSDSGDDNTLASVRTMNPSPLMNRLIRSPTMVAVCPYHGD